MVKKALPFQDVALVAERIRKIRLDKKLSAVAISKEIGLSFQTIGSWERAESEPPLSYLSYLANKFDVDLNWLILGKIKEDDAIEDNKDGKIDLDRVELELLRENRELQKENTKLREEAESLKRIQNASDLETVPIIEKLHGSTNSTMDDKN